MKKCARCKDIKEDLEFPINKKLKSGLGSYCLVCRRKHYNELKAKNPERYKAYRKGLYAKTKEKRSAWNKAKYLENPEFFKKKFKNYCERNRDKVNSRDKALPTDTVDILNKKSFNRAKSNLRSRTYFIFKYQGYKKPQTTEKILGASFGVVKVHIERQFKKGMSWKNYGAWHIDHKIPLSSAKDINELKVLCHYTNLQPLWEAENLSKNNSIVTTQMVLTI